MTAKQKRIVGALALANVVVIIGLIIAMTRPAPDAPARSSALPTPAPEATCRWHAARALAEAGGHGTVALTPQGTLAFTIEDRLSPGETVDEAAQRVWIAFDAALALRDVVVCDDVSRVAVTIRAVRPRTAPPPEPGRSVTRIRATVSRADLEAFDDGELSEEAFIDRVRYTTETLS